MGAASRGPTYPTMPHMVRPPSSVQTRLREPGEPAGDLRTRLGVVPLDHDPQLRLGTGRPDQDPSPAPEHVRCLGHGGAELGVDLPLILVTDGRVYHHLWKPRDPRGEL